MLYCRRKAVLVSREGEGFRRRRSIANEARSDQENCGLAAVLPPFVLRPSSRNTMFEAAFQMDILFLPHRQQEKQEENVLQEPAAAMHLIFIWGCSKSNTISEISPAVTVAVAAVTVAVMTGHPP